MVVVLVVLVLSLSACTSGRIHDSGQEEGLETTAESAPHASCLDDEGLLEVTPAEEGNYLSEGFDRVTRIQAPGGGELRLYAQSDLTDGMVLRARNLLRFFLTDVPQSTWGADKSDVFDQMADNGAVMALINGADGQGREPRVQGQWLFEDETPVEGSSWYMENDYQHRDAAFEEIFHLVHDAGIGTYLPGARPEYQAALLAEAEAALDDGRWGIPVDPGVTQWIQELRREGSLAQEYIASVIDSYYGLWGPWDEDEGGMWGIYIAKTREEMESLDPSGMALLEAFLPPTLDGYEARLAEDLEGTFSLVFDASEPYTHKSRYLVDVTLTGSNDVDLVGNAEDNTLRGNAGSNEIDGGEGTDTVVYCHDHGDLGSLTEADDGSWIVDGPGGVDVVRQVQFLRFSDLRVQLP